MNTLGRLKQLKLYPPIIKQDGSNIIILYPEKNPTNYHYLTIKIVEKENGNNDSYKLITEHIKENSFKLNRIKKELEKYFKNIYVYNTKLKKLEDNNDNYKERAFFVCYKS